MWDMLLCSSGFPNYHSRSLQKASEIIEKVGFRVIIVKHILTSPPLLVIHVTYFSLFNTTGLLQRNISYITIIC